MWLKLDSGFWSNPTWILLPWASPILYCYLLCDIKTHGDDKSSVSVTHWHPEVLKHVLRLPISTDEVSDAMSALEKTGKVIVSKDRVSIDEWNKFQSDPSNADRQRRHRENALRNGETPLHTVSNGEIERIDRENRKERTEDPPLPPKGTSVTQSGFDEFWSAYPKKIGKVAARKKWQQTAKTRPPLPDILAAIDRQRRSDQWTREEGRFIPLPTTWLNQHRWEDGGIDLSLLESPEDRRKREGAEKLAEWMAQPEEPGRIA